MRYGLTRDESNRSEFAGGFSGRSHGRMRRRSNPESDRAGNRYRRRNRDGENGWRGEQGCAVFTRQIPRSRRCDAGAVSWPSPSRRTRWLRDPPDPGAVHDYCDHRPSRVACPPAGRCPRPANGACSTRRRPIAATRTVTLLRDNAVQTRGIETRGGSRIGCPTNRLCLSRRRPTIPARPSRGTLHQWVWIGWPHSTCHRRAIRTFQDGVRRVGNSVVALDGGGVRAASLGPGTNSPLERLLRLQNRLVDPCARHDSNVRPLPPQGSALSPELRALSRRRSLPGCGPFARSGPQDPVARLAQEAQRGLHRIVLGLELPVEHGGALEARIAEELVDPAGPRRDVEVGLGVVRVAR